MAAATRAAGIHSAADQGNDDAVGARVEDLLEPGGFVVRDPDQGRGAGGERLEQALRAGRLDRAVLHVDEDPLEAGELDDLGDLARVGGQEDANERLAFAQPLVKARLHGATIARESGVGVLVVRFSRAQDLTDRCRSYRLVVVATGSPVWPATMRGDSPRSRGARASVATGSPVWPATMRGDSPRVARREGIGAADALDVVQDAFHTLLGRSGLSRGLRGQPEGAARLLGTIVRNAARNLRRRHHLARPHVDVRRE